MVDITLNIAFVLIFFSIVFGIIRLVIGPDTVYRVVAVDLLTIIAIAGLAREEARHKLFFESEYDERVLTDN